MCPNMLFYYRRQNFLETKLGLNYLDEFRIFSICLKEKGSRTLRFFFHSNVKMEGTAPRNNFQLPRSLTQVSLIQDFLYLGYRRKLLQNSANCRQLSVRWCSAVHGIIAVVRSAFPKAN